LFNISPWTKEQLSEENKASQKRKFEFLPKPIDDNLLKLATAS